MRVDLPRAVTVTVQYVNDYYDGPLTGVCSWKGERYYFTLHSDEGEMWVYLLHPMTTEEWFIEDVKHAEWNACSGNFSYDFPPDHKPDPAKLPAFYEAHYDCGEAKDLTLPAVAWFTGDAFRYPERRGA
jgi:hypothetical protein